MPAGQPIIQSSTVTPGHVGVWTTDGVLQDGGPATEGAASGFGITANGGISFAISTANPPNPYVQYGISVNANGTITFYMEGFGGAPAATLFYNINGVTYPFNPSSNGNITGPTSSVSGDIVTFNGIGGNIVEDSGVNISSVVLPSSALLFPIVANVAALEAATATTLPQTHCYLLGYYAAGDGGAGVFYIGTTTTANGGTIFNDASGRSWYRQTAGQPYSIKWFGATGLNSADDSSFVQATINAAIAARVTGIYVPSASLGYQIGTAINLTNLNAALTIEGDGINAPAFGLAITPPVGGSLFLGNTGTGKPVFDCSGSNNIIFRNMNINAIGQSAPSSIGILFATSTTSPTVQAPGGTNCGAENVAVYMPNTATAIDSVPIAWISGAGLGSFINVWTLGVYGIALSGSNVLGLSSPYVTFGSDIGIDGIVGIGCRLLGYGGAQVLYIDNCNNQTWEQLYVVTILGGSGYAGQPYPIFLDNVIDVYIKVESDYWPSLMETGTSNIDNVTVVGTCFPNATPIPSNIPAIAFFAGSFSEVNCSFDVKVVAGALPNSNYYYSTEGGGSPTISGFNDCDFAYDLTVSPNVFFGNCNNSLTVPFFNLRFNGNTDAGTSGPLTFFVNGSSVATSGIRVFINGKVYGTA